MEYGFSFMPYYLHLASFFVHGEFFNQQEPMIFLTVCRCSRLCEKFHSGTLDFSNFHVGTFRLHLHFWPNLNFLLEHLMKVILIVQSGVIFYLSSYK